MEATIVGNGTPLVLVPGIQGRWEYARPTIEALSASFRVITFPLCGERASRRRFDAARGFDNFVDQIDDVLEQSGHEAAVVCGVSFGGLVALRYAASRPARTSALVLVSTPGPGFRVPDRHRLYARAPLLFGPAFLAEMPGRVGGELAETFPSRRDRARFGWWQIRTFLRAPVSVRKMAERSKLVGAVDPIADGRRVVAPTLVVTGEASLDRVVPVGGSREYARIIRGARAVRMEGTGHLGSVTRPALFADLVSRFLKERGDAAA